MSGRYPTSTTFKTVTNPTHDMQQPAQPPWMLLAPTIQCTHLQEAWIHTGEGDLTPPLLCPPLISPLPSFGQPKPSAPQQSWGNCRTNPQEPLPKGRENK